MESKSVLGKGLASLLGSAEIERAASRSFLKMCPVSKIVPKGDQPRRTINEDSIAELAKSIKEKGVLQPIIVEENNGYFEIIAGERRWRACKHLGMNEIPAIVKKFDNHEKLLVALIENLQREDINAVEEARAYQLLRDKYNLSTHEIADRIGKDRSTVANSIRLLDLPGNILNHIVSEKLSEGAGRALLQIKDAKLLQNLAKRAVEESLSVRQIEALTKKYKQELKGKEQKIKKGESPVIFSYVEQLKKRFQTMVKINNKKRGGSIIIDYYSDEDLERILNLLR